MTPRYFRQFLAVALMLMAAFVAPQSLYAQCVTPPTGMVGWWPLDETTGSTANDIAGSFNNSGAWTNGPVSATGIVAGALSFNGSNYVAVPDQTELNFGTGDFSIDFWVKTTNSSGTRTILDKRTGSIPNIAGYVLFMVNGNLGSQIGDGTGYNNCVTTGFVADGNWHHVALTVDRDNTQGWLHYVDGNRVGAAGNPTGWPGSLTNTAPLVMARNLLNPTQTFAGTLDEVELFNRVLDSLEIRSIWAADSAGKCKTTLGAILGGNGLLAISGTLGPDSILLRLNIWGDTLEIDDYRGPFHNRWRFPVALVDSFRILTGEGDDWVVFADDHGSLTNIFPFYVDLGEGVDAFIGGTGNYTSAQIEVLDSIFGELNKDLVNFNIIRDSAEELMLDAAELRATYGQALVDTTVDFFADAQQLIDSAEALYTTADNQIAAAVGRLLSETDSLLQIMVEIGDSVDVFSDSEANEFIQRLELLADSILVVANDSNLVNQLSENMEIEVDSFEIKADTLEARVKEQLSRSETFFDSLQVVFEALGNTLLAMIQAQVGDAGDSLFKRAVENLSGDTLSAQVDAINHRAELLEGMADSLSEAILAVLIDIFDDTGVPPTNARQTPPLDCDFPDPSNIIKGGYIMIGSNHNDMMIGTSGTNFMWGRGGNDRMKGDDGFDIMWGNGATDDMYGEGGFDIMWGNDTIDCMRGGDDMDIMWGNRGNDWIDGGDGCDLVFGDEGDDEMYGNTGDDIMNGGHNNDIMHGDNGVDFMFGDWFMGAYPGIDTMYGGAGTDVMCGNGKEDVMYGGADADLMCGNGESDEIHGEGSADFMCGNEGEDKLYGGDGTDVMWGNRGNDWMEGGTGTDFMCGDEDNDRLYGGGDADFMWGDDPIIGTQGDDVMFGGYGIDFMWGNEGHDLMGGDDGIDFMWGNKGNDRMSGGNQTDIMFGCDGDDCMDGNDATDFMWGNRDMDRMFGGLGNDLMSGDESFDFMNGDAGIDVMFGKDNNDDMNGNDGIDFMCGGGNEDAMDGGAGTDIMLGGQGNDRMDGGTEPDIMWGDDPIIGSQGDDVVFGGDGNDIMWGNRGIDEMKGGDGNDIMWGNLGNDKMEGDKGTDLMWGDEDNDRMDGGADWDMMFGNLGNDIMFGSPGTDIMSGNNGDDCLDGGDNTDLMLGRPGIDRMFGGNNPDFMFGGDGGDCMEGDAGDDFMLGRKGDDSMNGNDGNDWMLGNLDKDLMDGGNDNDFMCGNRGEDQMYGGYGDDWMRGNADPDIMYGGPGNDNMDGGLPPNTVVQDGLSTSGVTCPHCGGTIVITNNTIGGDGIFSYSGTGPFGSFTITTASGTGSQTFANVEPGNYTVTEQGPSLPWFFTSLVRTDPDNGTTVSGQTANIDLDPGETVVCTYTNTKSGTCVDPPWYMVGWWPLDETSGSIVYEQQAGWNNNGSSTPGPIGSTGPISVPAVVSTGLLFPAQDWPRYVIVSDHPDIDFGTGDFTIDAWIKPENPENQDLINPIVCKLDDKNTGYRFFIIDHVLCLQIGCDGGYLSSAMSTSPVTYGVWSHVAVTVNRDSWGDYRRVDYPVVSFYINGASAGSGLTGNPLMCSIDTPVNLWIGNSRQITHPGRFGETIIDELELFKRELLQSEVQSIYDAGSFGKCKQDSSYLPGDGNGDGIVDISDAVHLISYIFSGGSAPEPLEAGDANCDGIVDISDAVYLISYIFSGGAAPCSGSYGKLSPEDSELLDGSSSSDATLKLAESESTTASSKINAVEMQTDIEVAGLQLEFKADVGTTDEIVAQTTERSKNLQLFSGVVDGLFRVGLIDMTGKKAIAAGDGPIVSLESKGDKKNLEFVNAIASDRDGKRLNVKIEQTERASALPKQYSLSQNYPNPFNPSTEIRFALPKSGEVRIEVMNVLGQSVKTLANGFQTAGIHSVTWDGTDERGNSVASGVYVYRIVSDEFRASKKMLLLK